MMLYGMNLRYEEISKKVAKETGGVVTELDVCWEKNLALWKKKVKKKNLFCKK